jgi:hypothetical protein
VRAVEHCTRRRSCERLCGRRYDRRHADDSARRRVARGVRPGGRSFRVAGRRPSAHRPICRCHRGPPVHPCRPGARRGDALGHHHRARFPHPVAAAAPERRVGAVSRGGAVDVQLRPRSGALPTARSLGQPSAPVVEGARGATPSSAASLR